MPITNLMKPLFSLILLFSFMSRADQCKPTRLDAPGQVMHNSPVLDQDGLKWCDYYKAGKLMDAVRFYKNGKKPVSFETSPIPLAVQVATDKKQNELEFLATAHDIVNIGLKNGSCSHEAVRKRFGSDVEQNYCSEVKTVMQSITANNMVGSASSNGSCQLRRDPIWGLRGTSVLTKALNIDESLTSLQSEFKKLCSGNNHESLDDMPMAYQHYAMDETDPSQRLVKLKNKMDSILDSTKPMPVGIRYCMDFLIAGQADTIKVDPITGKSSNTRCNQGGLHASVVTGRRKGPRGCQYLIHNSHGTSCNKYASKWECEEGKIWVDEDNLLKNTIGLVIVEMK